MNFTRWDLGEIIRSHVYVREIQSICYESSDNHLLASKELFEKITKIYEYLGVTLENNEVYIQIKLPSNPNSEYSKKWHLTYLKVVEEKPIITLVDSLARYFTKEVVFASDKWLCSYESFPGDDVIISPCVPSQYALC